MRRSRTRDKSESQGSLRGRTLWLNPKRGFPRLRSHTPRALRTGDMQCSCTRWPIQGLRGVSTGQRRSDMNLQSSSVSPIGIISGSLESVSIDFLCGSIDTDPNDPGYPFALSPTDGRLLEVRAMVPALPPSLCGCHPLPRGRFSTSCRY